MRVLVLGGRSLVALDLVRNLGRHGHEVHVAESVAVNPSAWSRYARSSVRVRSPRFRFRAFLHDVAAAVEAHGVDLVVPTCEETFHVARGAEWLRRRCPGVRVTAGAFEDLAVLHDKQRAMELLRGFGVAVPATELVAGRDETAALLRRDRPGPLVLKRRFSRFGAQVRLLAPGERRLPADVDADAADWVAQEFVEGRLHCAYAFAHEGRLLACAQYADAGADPFRVLTSFQPVRDPRLQEAIERVVSRLRYSGHISFDAIVGEDRAVVIECNPRVTSGVHCLAGTDLGTLFAAGGAAPAPAPAPAAPAQIRVLNLLRRGRRGGLDRGVRDVVHASDDPMPSLAYPLLVAGFALTALRRRIPLVAATTHDIEWNGEELPGP